MYRGAILALVCVTMAAGTWAQNSRDRDRKSTDSDVIPAGARIPIRIDQTIDIRVPSDGRVFTGTTRCPGWKSEQHIKGGAKIDHETPGKRRFVAVQK
jgi:hypothetical protein